MILTKKEKEGLVIQLASQGKTTRQIAQLAHVSLKDIGTIIRRFTGEELEYQNKDLSITSKAFQMFKENKSRVEVAIALNLESHEVISLFHDYLQLRNLDRLVTAHQYLGHDLPIFLDLFDKMREEGIVTQPAIARLAQSAVKLARLEEECLDVCDQIGKLNDKKVEIEKEIEAVSSLLHYLRDCLLDRIT